MPPGPFSRYLFCQGLTDDRGRLYLSERVPFRHRELPDNRAHLVAEGDTLFSLAGSLFAPLPRPAGLYWIIADFQPEPIIDPTLTLLPRYPVLVIPSIRTVLEEIFNEARRPEFSG